MALAANGFSEFQESLRNFAKGACLAERNVLSFVFVKMLRKSRCETWRREWETSNAISRSPMFTAVPDLSRATDLASSNLRRRFRPLAGVWRFFYFKGTRNGIRHGTRRNAPLKVLERHSYEFCGGRSLDLRALQTLSRVANDMPLGGEQGHLFADTRSNRTRRIPPPVTSKPVARRPRRMNSTV